MKQETIAGLGLGILSWRGYDSLEPMLEKLTASGLTHVFGEKRIFFPEMGAEGERIARAASFEYSGSSDNLGIYGGFRALAESMHSDFLLLLENDLQLLEPYEEAYRQLQEATRLVATGKVDFVLLRHCKYPGEQFSGLDKFRRYHPPHDAPPLERVAASLRNLIRPSKGKRLIGYAPYAEKHPEHRFEEVSVEPQSGFHLMTSAERSWTNQSVLISREFFLKTILEQVENSNSKRRINGFKNMEIELNSKLWRQQKWKIAIAPGLFSHNRHGHRGY